MAARRAGTLAARMNASYLIYMHGHGCVLHMNIINRRAGVLAAHKNAPRMIWKRHIWWGHVSYMTDSRDSRMNTRKEEIKRKECAAYDMDAPHLMSLIGLIRVTHAWTQNISRECVSIYMDESRHSFESWLLLGPGGWRWRTCSLRLIDICCMTHSCVWHDWFMFPPRARHWWWRTCSLWCIHVDLYDWVICVPWLIHLCAMTHSFVCYNSFICLPWLIQLCAMTDSHFGWAMTHLYLWHDSFICVTWLMHMCAMTH